MQCCFRKTFNSKIPFKVSKIQKNNFVSVNIMETVIEDLLLVHFIGVSQLMVLGRVVVLNIQYVQFCCLSAELSALGQALACFDGYIVVCGVNFFSNFTLTAMKLDMHDYHKV